MQLKTILNRVQKHRSFVYGPARFVQGARLTIEVEVRARANARAECSGCGRPAPRYDMQPTRRFEFVPLWGIAVFLVYAMRRVSCASCGVRVERVPWATGKHQLTDTYAWFLARWAKRLSWKEVAEVFHTSWEKVFRSVEMAVEWGRAQRDLGGVEAIGIDEIQWQRGHRYLTLVYQIDVGCRRLLWVGQDRKVKTLLGFFRWFGKERSAALEFICSDMWRPYIKVIKKKAGQALHIMDRFHLVAKLNKAIDEVRAGEHRQMQGDGYEPVLQALQMVPTEAAGELDGKAGSQVEGPTAVQSDIGARLLA